MIIESIFFLLVDFRCMLLEKTLNVPVLVLVLVWFWFGLLCQCPLSQRRFESRVHSWGSPFWRLCAAILRLGAYPENSQFSK